MHPNRLVFRQGVVHPACQVARQDGLYVCLPPVFLHSRHAEIASSAGFLVHFCWMRAGPFWSLVHTKQNREASHATGPRAFRAFFCAARWPRLNGSERFRTVPNGSKRLLSGSGAIRARALEFQSLGGECKVVMCQVAQSSHASPGILQEITICARICHFAGFPTGAIYRYIRYDFLCKTKFATCSIILSMTCQKSRSSVCVRELPPGRSVETTPDNQKCAQTFKQLNRSEPFLQSKPATT